MHLTGRFAELFEAFSKINATAYADDHLLSCPVLSKAPNYGNILERFLSKNDCSSLPFSRRFALVARYMASNTGHLAFLLMVAFFCRVIGWKSPKQSTSPSPKSVLLDTFAILPDIAKSGRFTDRYLPGLKKEIRESGARPVYYYRLYGSRNPVVLYKALKVLQKSGEGITEVHCLRFSDWLRLVWHLLVYPFSLQRLITRLQFATKGSPEQYIRQALCETAGQCIMHGEAARLAGKRIASLFHTPPLLISWYENQTINKAFYRGIRQGITPVTIIGAQLLVWPEALLNNHPDDREAALGLAPDKALVNGTWFLPEKSQQKFAVGPSLRYKALFEKAFPVSPNNLEESAAQGQAEIRAESAFLLALLSYHPEETEKVLTLIQPLVQQGKKVAFKFHPATNPQDFQHLLPPSPQLVQGNLYDALNNTQAVIGSGSGALAEAAALGIPTLAVEEDTKLSLNYLPPFGEGIVWEKVGSPEQVEPALCSLLKQQRSQEYTEVVYTLRSMLFTEPTQECIREAFELCPRAYTK